MATASLRNCAFCGNHFSPKLFSNTKYCSFYCRFLDIAVDFNGNDSCWNWPKAVNIQTGYGQFMVLIEGKQKLLSAHRLSAELFLGGIPHGLDVCHKCDNRQCFNPAHLFMGTAKDNIRDMFSKGRQRDYSLRPAGYVHPSIAKPECLQRGGKHYAAKTTEEVVAQVKVRLAESSMAEVAREFNLSYGCVTSIKYGTAWKHVKV